MNRLGFGEELGELLWVYGHICEEARSRATTSVKPLKPFQMPPAQSIVVVVVALEVAKAEKEKEKEKEKAVLAVRFEKIEGRIKIEENDKNEEARCGVFYSNEIRNSFPCSVRELSVEPARMSFSLLDTFLV